MRVLPPSTRRRLLLLLLVVGLGGLTALLGSRESGLPDAWESEGGASRNALPGPTGLRSAPPPPSSSGRAGAPDVGRPALPIAGRVTGSLERAVGQDAGWRCTYQVTSAAGGVLGSGSLTAGALSVDWPWEPGGSISLAAVGCRTFHAELPGRTTDLGVVRLLPSLLYRGRLQSAAGVAIAGALVELVGRARSRVGRPATTDEAGGFALETDLRELPFPSPDGGTYPDLWLFATRPERGETCRVAARPSGFFDAHMAVVEFERGVVILVRRPDGTPVPGAGVHLDPDTDGGTPFTGIPSAFGGTTDADGRCGVGWPPSLPQVGVRVRVPGESEAFGFLRVGDVTGEQPVALTLPAEGNRIELSLRRGGKGRPGDHDVLSLRAQWTTPASGSGDVGVNGIGLQAPIPPDGQPWSVRLLDSPSLRFEQILTSARWRARYLGSGGLPAISDGTVELRRVPSGLEGEILLPSASSGAEPEDVLWLRVREEDGAAGTVESLALVPSREGRAGPARYGRVAWTTPATVGGGDRLIAIEEIPPPRAPSPDVASPDAVAWVLRSSGGGQRVSRSSLAQWARAYDPETPLVLDLVPGGSIVRILVRSSDGVAQPNVELLAMCVDGVQGSEAWTEEEHVTDAAGGADILPPRADLDLLVLAKTGDGRMGRVPVKAGVRRAEVVLTRGDVLATTIHLVDGRTPVEGHAYLSTRPHSRWSVPCVWDATASRFTSAQPVLLEAFELRMDVYAYEATGRSALERKELRYRLAVPAQDAQGKTVELPRLQAGARSPR